MKDRTKIKLSLCLLMLLWLPGCDNPETEKNITTDKQISAIEPHTPESLQKYKADVAAYHAAHKVSQADKKKKKTR